MKVDTIHSEVLSVESDKTLGGMPRELKRRKSGAPPRPPALWNARPTVEQEGEWGAFPKDFVRWACKALQCPRSEVLHVCSGSLVPGDGRARVDLRRETAPDVAADGRALPFRDGEFRAVLIDPPYSTEYARDLYGTEYPRPSHLLTEAARVTQPCGRVGIFHFLVPMPPKDRSLQMEKVWGVTTGAGYRIRAFTVFRKVQDELPGLTG